MSEDKKGGEKRKRHGDNSSYYQKPKSGPKKKFSAPREKPKPEKVKAGGYQRTDEGLIDQMTQLRKAIIITGAAGGLGKAIVKCCMERFPGLAIVATDISPEVNTMFEGPVLAYQMDVTDEASIAALRMAIEEKELQVWAIVNNAGVSDFFPITEKSKESLEKIFAINTFGPVNMVRAFLPHLIETKGRVVNISSESVRLPAAFHPYANTKIDQYTSKPYRRL